jgi:hypothetical protein
MLKLAWYLITDRDYWTETAEHRQPTPVRELASTLNCLFSDEAEFTPAQTATATDIMLHMAAYLCDSVRHGPATAPDPAAFDRLLHGINLLLAYMAQAVGRLTYQVETGTGADLSTLPPADRAELVTILAVATKRLEETAGLIKQGHRAARSRPGAAQ